MVKKLRYVFDRKDKIKLVGLAILMVIGSVLELLAVAVFNPFIEVLMQTSSIEDDSFFEVVLYAYSFKRNRTVSGCALCIDCGDLSGEKYIS